MHNYFFVLTVSIVLAVSGVAPCAAQTETPDIIFNASPAVLVPVDGKPVYRDVSGTTLRRVVNTKVLILRDDLGVYYLRILGGWMQAYELGSWWEVAGAPPHDLDLALNAAIAAKDADLLTAVPGSPDRLSAGADLMPAVFVATKPTVLIVTDGAPRFAAVPGTSLEYVANTTGKVFREPTDQELYVMTSGHWFRAWKMDGPWQPIQADQLPADFARIPDTLTSNPGGPK